MNKTLCSRQKVYSKINSFQNALVHGEIGCSRARAQRAL